MPETPDHTGCMARVLITGSTDGIGLRTAQLLAEGGAEVVVHGRDEGRVAEAVTAVGDRAVTGLVADFTDLDQVADLAAQVAPLGVDAVINNAGVYCRQRETTVDGHEQMWQVNHLAPTLLTELLVPSLPAGGRVVSVSSSIHQRGEIDLADPDYEQRRWHHFKAHAATKLAAVQMTRQWSARYPAQVFLAVHPGIVDTKLLRDGMKVPGQDSLDEGAATSVYAITAPGLASGSYLAHAAPADACPNALDDQAAAALYDATIGILGLAAS